MRISELSRASGVPVATVKYYLREGLLHEGRRTSATQAQYDDGHLARLRLIRALLGVGGLGVAAARGVLAELADPPESMFEVFGDVQAHLQAGAREPEGADAVDTGPAIALIEEMGWRLEADAPEVRRLASAMEALAAADFALPEGRLRYYAEAMSEVAEWELSTVPKPPDEAVRYVVLGSILVEPLLLALRRAAHVDAAQRRFNPDAGADRGGGGTGTGDVATD